MSELTHEEAKKLPLNCIMHPTRAADRELTTQREIAEFGVVKFGLCATCHRRKTNNPVWNTKIVERLNQVLLAERRRKEDAESNRG